MITLCWGAKGGSGVTTVAATLALAHRRPTLLLDLDGDAALALGIGHEPGPTFDDWFSSTAPADRLLRLALRVNDDLQLIPARQRVERTGARWRQLAELLPTIGTDVVIDAGTGAPPWPLRNIAGQSLLVIRPCYLALVRAQRLGIRPDGIVLVDEPGRALDADDITAGLGAPIVATVSLDPKIARAVDSGLGVSRLPFGCLRQLRSTA